MGPPYPPKHASDPVPIPSYTQYSYYPPLKGRQRPSEAPSTPQPPPVIYSNPNHTIPRTPPLHRDHLSSVPSLKDPLLISTCIPLLSMTRGQTRPRGVHRYIVKAPISTREQRRQRAEKGVLGSRPRLPKPHPHQSPLPPHTTARRQIRTP
jgi:hypothetical protein